MTTIIPKIKFKFFSMHNEENLKEFDKEDREKQKITTNLCKCMSDWRKIIKKQALLRLTKNKKLQKAIIPPLTMS